MTESTGTSRRAQRRPNHQHYPQGTAFHSPAVGPSGSRSTYSAPAFHVPNMPASRSHPDNTRRISSEFFKVPRTNLVGPGSVTTFSKPQIAPPSPPCRLVTVPWFDFGHPISLFDGSGQAVRPATLDEMSAGQQVILIPLDEPHPAPPSLSKPRREPSSLGFISVDVESPVLRARIDQLKQDHPDLHKLLPSWGGNTEEVLAGVVSRLELFGQNRQPGEQLYTVLQTGPKGGVKVCCCRFCDFQHKKAQEIYAHVFNFHWSIKAWICKFEHPEQTGNRFIRKFDLDRHHKDAHKVSRPRELKHSGRVGAPRGPKTGGRRAEEATNSSTSSTPSTLMSPSAPGLMSPVDSRSHPSLFDFTSTAPYYVDTKQPTRQPYAPVDGLETFLSMFPDWDYSQVPY